MAGSSWSVQETRALLNLWGDTRTQSELAVAIRNKAIYQRIQRDFVRLGYNRTWQQCRVKIKNLTASYRKIKDDNSRSGRGRSNFVFFDAIDRILGHRPASRPTNLLSSSTPPSSNSLDDSHQIPPNE